ncbi:hypothetical protein OAO18_09220 [Francisellaceae bacterium]|nr:hypothetical protein [Francisellaceae bacterium]
MRILQSSKAITGFFLVVLFGVFGLAGCAAVDSGVKHQPDNQNKMLVNIKNGLVSIHNESNYVIECSQMIGGYCSQNPILQGNDTTLLPDPGSLLIRGHIMAFNPNVPGKYVDNIVFKSEKINGVWHSSTVSLYQASNIKVKNNLISIAAN